MDEADKMLDALNARFPGNRYNVIG
jgi:hypothetical protein